MLRAVLVLLCAAGCGESMKSIVDKQRAAAEPKLAQIIAIAADVAKRPPSTGETLTLPPGTTLEFSWSQPGHNASLVYDHYLADPCATTEINWKDAPKAPSYLGPLDTGSDWLRPAHCMLRDGKWFMDTQEIPADRMKEAFARLERTRYLLVVRVSEAKRPSLSMKEIEANKVESFEGGRMAGDLLVYEIAGAKFLGGVTWSAESKDTVEVTSGGMSDQLMYDLLTDAAWALRKQIGTFSGGSTPP